MIVKYLYTHKQVTLQGIGTITLNSEVPDNEFIAKNKQFPIENISLAYNPKAGVDEGLAAFYGTERGKIKSLAQSDIESTLQLARQILNIGKSYEIEGLGNIEKQSDGTLVLIGGYFVIPYADDLPKPGKLKEREVEPQNWKKTDEQEPSISNAAKRTMLIVAASLIALLALFFAWSKWQGQPSDVESTDATAVNGDSAVLPAMPDSAAARLDSPMQNTLPPQQIGAISPSDSNAIYNFRAYFRTYTNSADAIKGFNFHSKTSAKPFIDSATPNSYKLYVMLTSRVADTTYKADSMRKWYAGKIVLQKQ